MNKGKPIIGIPLSIVIGRDFQSSIKDPSLISNNPEILYLKTLSMDAIWKAGGIPVYIPVIDDPCLYLDLIDGLLIPGGDDIHPQFYGGSKVPFAKYEQQKKTESDIKLVREAYMQRLPLLGLCYGMQLINVALGGSLWPEINDFTAFIQHGAANDIKEHKITLIENTLISKIFCNKIDENNSIIVSSSHHQAVMRLGNGLHSSALAVDGVIEAIELEEDPDQFFLGVEWHPEWDSTGELLFAAFINAAKEYKKTKV